MTHDRHLDERLDDWLDGRLDERQRRDVEAHLAACASCRGLRDALVAARAALRSALPDEEPPAGLAARIGAALDREDRAAPPAPALRPAAPGSRLRRVALPIAAALGLAALALWLLGDPPAGDPVAAAFEQYERLRGPETPPALALGNPGELDRRWRRADLGFPARVLDLSAMGIVLAGGDVTRLAGAPAARALYRGAGEVYVCWMFEGDEEALQPPVEMRSHGGFDFRVYRRGGATLVVWREGEVLCALAGEGDPEGVIALAFAKAMAPGAPGSGGSSEG